jgi:hypothetical protein
MSNSNQAEDLVQRLEGLSSSIGFAPPHLGVECSQDGFPTLARSIACTFSISLFHNCHEPAHFTYPYYVFDPVCSGGSEASFH